MAIPTLGLPVSKLVRVDVFMSPQAAATRSFGSLLICGDSDVIDVTERIRQYDTVEAVGLDFGAGSPEYKAAALAQAIRSGLSIPQNIEQIRPIGFVSTGQAVRVPELVNQRHYNRVDFTAFFRLARQQRYAALNVLEAPLQLNKD